MRLHETILKTVSTKGCSPHRLFNAVKRQHRHVTDEAIRDALWDLVYAGEVKVTSNRTIIKAHPVGGEE